MATIPATARHRRPDRPLAAAARRPARRSPGRAEYTHNLRLPGMLHGKIFRRTVAHGRIKSIDTSAAKAVPGVYRVVTSEDVRKVIPHPYYGPAFHDQPILAIDKVHYVGEPVAVVLAEDPHVADAGRALIVAEYEELPAVYDEVEAAAEQDLGARRAQARRHLRRPQAPQGRQGHQHRARLPAAQRRRRQGVRRRPRTCSSTSSAPRRCCISPFEPFVSIADFKDKRLTLYTASQGPSFVRIEIARLLGWPENRVRIKVPFLGGGYGGKLYIKLEALVTALSLIAKRPVKVSLPLEEMFYTITRHPTTFRIKSAVDDDGQHHRAALRGVLERRRLCRHRPAGDAEIRLHRVGPLRHRERVDRFLRALHQPAAVRRAARLRRAAAGVGLREPHRHDRAGAQDRSARIPPQEHHARGRPHATGTPLQATPRSRRCSSASRSG